MMTNTTDPMTRAGKRKLTSSGSDVWLESSLFLELPSEFRPSSPGVFNLCILLLLWRRGIAVTNLCKELPGHTMITNPTPRMTPPFVANQISLLIH